MSVEVPEAVKKALGEWAEEVRGRLKSGDLVVVEWGDAADEKQVVAVKGEKVATPVRTVGFFYGVLETSLGPHLVIVSHVFSEKWKDMTYIPLGWVQRITVRGNGRRQRLISEKTWRGNAHTRKMRIGRRTKAIHLARVKEVLGG